MRNDPPLKMFEGAPPAWALSRNKSYIQTIYDFVGAPLRMVLLPDHVSEQWHLTSLRAERLGMVLDALRGRCLDIGAGDNMLLRLYRERSRQADSFDDAVASVGVDVVDWGSDCVILPNCRSLPFESASFDTVTFVACINHIPEREAAVAEAFRVLRPGGQIIITMIGSLIGKIGHAIWWYSEDKHRDIADGEVMGMDADEIERLIAQSGFTECAETGFVYGLNRMWIARRPL